MDISFRKLADLDDAFEEAEESTWFPVIFIYHREDGWRFEHGERTEEQRRTGREMYMKFTDTIAGWNRWSKGVHLIPNIMLRKMEDELLPMLKAEGFDTKLTPINPPILRPNGDELSILLNIRESY